MGKSYSIRISSQKGGVGKTTIATNLSTVLQLFNYKVLLVDADYSNPSVGFHLGMEQVNIGYNDVLQGKSMLRTAIAIHSPTGMHVLPGTISAKPFIPDEDEMEKLASQISKAGYDFVVFDTSPGYITDEPLDEYDEALLLTTPEMSACTASIRLAHMYDLGKLKHNMIVNRVKNKRYEITVDEIEEMYENKVVGVIPEDEVVPVSISEHIPAYLLDPNVKFSKSISAVGRKYASKSGSAYTESIIPKFGIIDFIKRLFRLR